MDKAKNVTGIEDTNPTQEKKAIPGALEKDHDNTHIIFTVML